MTELKFKVDDLIIELKSLSEQLNKATRTCIPCASFTKSEYYCTLYNSKVPAEIIIVGCDSFSDDIPF